MDGLTVTQTHKHTATLAGKTANT